LSSLGSWTPIFGKPEGKHRKPHQPSTITLTFRLLSANATGAHPYLSMAAPSDDVQPALRDQIVTHQADGMGSATGEEQGLSPLPAPL
jgi:hypothetical protein